MTGRGEPYLVEQFRKFYSEVIQLKRMVRFRIRSAAEEGVVWQRLLTFLEKQGISAERRGAQARFYEEAQYVMAALGDDIFLNLEWSGKVAWKDNLLESKLFGTHVAGERFFERIERLLRERDPAFSELAAVYLLALTLGFRGKYRGIDDQGEIATCRRRLFQFIGGREPALAEHQTRLFPRALDSTLDKETVRLLPRPRRWVIALAVVGFLYLIVSHEVWSYALGPLRDVVGEVLAPGTG